MSVTLFPPSIHQNIAATTQRSTPLLSFASSTSKDVEISIIDTGTYLIYAPPDVFRRSLSFISSIVKERNPSVTCEEKKKRLPSIEFIIQGLEGTGPVSLLLNPEDYVLHYQDNECYLGIVEDDAAEEDQLGGWTLGQVFLQSHYTVFDWDVPAVGFAKLGRT